MKPIVKVYCLPAGLSENQLNDLFKDIVSAMISVEELGVVDEDDVLVLFVPDMMAYGLGKEVLAEIDASLPFQEKTEEIKNRVATEIGKAIQERFPGAEVLVKVLSPMVMNRV